MPPRLESSLWDIREAGEYILTFTAGKTLEQYSADRMLQFAIERCFITIGEAIVRIRDHCPEDYLQLTESRKVGEFRNHLAHRYDSVIDDEVWRIIQVFLPLLLAEVSAALERIRT